MERTGWESIGWVECPVEGVAERLREVILPWEGTRYAKGQSVRGVATNCVGFFCRGLEELRGEPRREIPGVADDAAFHDPRTSIRGMRAIIQAYGPIGRAFRPLSSTERILVEPGDILVSGPTAGGPGHAAIVGWQPGTLWQAASGMGVHCAGLFIPGHKLFRVFRPIKGAWLR